MDLFKRRIVSVWQVGLVKLSVLGIGLAAGAYFHEFFAPYVNFFAILGIALGVVSALMWFRN